MGMTGLIAATTTAFAADGSLDLSGIEKQAEALAGSGVSRAFVCGTTGECASMTLEERMRVAQRWREVAALPVVVHVGHACLADARLLAMHAAAIGAAAVAATPPYYFKPANAETVVACAAAIADAAPGLPFYHYHIPSLTGVNIPALDVLRAADRAFPKLAGVKFTFESLHDFVRCMEHNGGQYDMLFGRDEMLLGALASGAAGAVGSTYGFAPRPYLRMIDAVNCGDLAAARVDQRRACAFIDIMIRHGGLSAAKSIMGLIGLDCGPMRLPLKTLDETARRQLQQDLEAIGFFDWRLK